MNKWQQVQGNVSQQGFLDLFYNKCACITVDNFLSAVECEALVKGLRSLGLKQYDYNFDLDEAPPAAHLFTTHYYFEEKQPAEYFPVAKESIEQYKKLVAMAGIDPFKKLLNLLNQHLNNKVKIAEQDGHAYSYVIARELNHSVLIHADFANFISSNWIISNILAQYAWNIYLTDPGEGGETTIYNRLWKKSDDQYILSNTYGYDPALVQNVEHVKFRPQVGTLMLFNSRNFHAVEKCEKPRLTMGGHAGLTPENDVLMWV